MSVGAITSVLCGAVTRPSSQLGGSAGGVADLYSSSSPLRHVKSEISTASLPRRQEQQTTEMFNARSHLERSRELLSGAALRGKPVKHRVLEAAAHVRAFGVQTSSSGETKAPKQRASEEHGADRPTRNRSGESSIAFTGANLVPLLRLGALQGRSPAAMRQTHLPTDLDMDGLDLRWVYDPQFRGSTKSSDGWCSLEHPSPDHLDSPRSVLALLRRGLRFSDLVPVGLVEERKRISIEGLSKAATESRLEFLVKRQRSKRDEALTEYRRLCRAIARQTVLQFIDAFIADGCDYARLPLLGDVETAAEPVDAAADNDGVRGDEGSGSLPPSPARSVRMTTDDRVADAMKGSLEKAAAEQQNLRVRAALEMEARNRVAELAQRRAAEAVAAVRRREEAEALRKQQRAEESALRALIAEQREKIRTDSRREQDAQLEIERAEREARYRELEAAMEQSKAARGSVRQKRVVEKRAAREAKAQAAEEAAARVEQRRLARIADAEAYSAEMEAKKKAEMIERLAEARRRTAENHERQAEARSRVATMLEAAREAAEARQEEVEATLAEFKRRKNIEGQVTKLRELQRSLIREDVAMAAAQREEVERGARQQQAKAQQARFEDFQVSVDQKRQLIVERAHEEKIAKRDYVDQHERAAEFQRYMTESNVAIKIATAHRVDDGRRAIVEQAREVRDAIQMERAARIKAANEARVVMERRSYFQTHVSLPAAAKATQRARTPAPHSTAIDADGHDEPPRPATRAGDQAVMPQLPSPQRSTPHRVPEGSQRTPLPADQSLL